MYMIGDDKFNTYSRVKITCTSETAKAEEEITRFYPTK